MNLFPISWFQSPVNPLPSDEEIEEDFVIMGPEDVSKQKITDDNIEALATLVLATSCQTNVEQMFDGIKFLADHIKNISSEKLAEHKQLFIRIFSKLGNLQEMKETSRLTSTQMGQIRSVKTQLTDLIPELSDHLALTTHFSIVGQLLLETMSDSEQGDLADSQNKVLRLEEQALIFGSGSNENEQRVINAKLGKLIRALEESEIIESLQNDDLLAIKLLSSFLMVGYTNEQKNGISLMEANLNKIYTVNQLVQQEIEKRKNENEDFQADARFSAAFKLVMSQMSDYLYTNSTWSNSKSLPQLAQFAKIRSSIMTVVKNPAAKVTDELEFLARDDVSGIALFKFAEQYVAILDTGSESLWDHCDIRQQAALSHGLGYAPVMSRFNEIEERTETFFQKHISEINDRESFEMLFAGFGLSGCVAQLLASKQAEKFKESQFTACGIGSAPYLSLDAADKVKKRNLYSMNFPLHGDINTRVSGWSNYVATEYANQEELFDSVYPLYTKDLGMLDITAHNLEEYCRKVNSAIEQPLNMMQNFQQLSQLCKIEEKK